MARPTDSSKITILQATGAGVAPDFVLEAGELAINRTDNYLFYENAAGNANTTAHFATNSNQIINWTSTSSNFSTSGTLACGELTSSDVLNCTKINTGHGDVEIDQDLLTTASCNVNRMITNGSYFQTRGTGDAEFYFHSGYNQYGGGAGDITDPSKWKMTTENVGGTALGHFGIMSKATGSWVEILDLDDEGNLQIDGDLTISGGNITNAITCDSTLTLGDHLYIPDMLVHSGDSNTRIRFPSVDTISFETNGVERLRMASAGEIGIAGTNYGSSGQVLTSGGSGAAVSWATVTASVSANSIGADELNVADDGDSGQVLTSDGDGSFSWSAKTTNTDVQWSGTSTGLTAATGRSSLGLGTGAVLSTAAIADGGTGLATADQIHTFVTSFGYLTADVSVADGGTGSSTASGARSNLGVDVAGTDNSTNVTLASVSGNYLSLSGQEITAGTVPLTLGGTGATTAGGARTALGLGTGAVLDTAAISDGGTGLATADQIHTFVTAFGYLTADVSVADGGTGSSTASGARTNLGLVKGISDGNVLAANDVVADNDFLRIDGTEVEGLTASEMRSALNVEDGATADQSQSDINGLAITTVGTISSGVWSGTALVAGKVPAITGLTGYTAAGYANASSTGSSSIATVGTVTTGTWNSSFGSSAYASTSSKGAASFSSDNFAVTSGVVTIKDSGIANDELAGSIADSKLSTISTAGKVAISALEIDGAGSSITALADADLFIADDGGGGSNKKVAASVIADYISAEIADGTTLSDSSGTLSLANPAGLGALNDSTIHNDDNFLVFDTDAGVWKTMLSSEMEDKYSSGGGGSGTITSGDTHNIAVYTASTTLDDHANFSYVHGTGTLNVPTSITCQDGHWELNPDGLYLGVNNFIDFEADASNAYQGLLKWPSVTSSTKTINLPDASGTVCVAGGTGLTLSSTGSMSVDSSQTITDISGGSFTVNTGGNISLDANGYTRFLDNGTERARIHDGGQAAYGTASTAITTGAAIVLKSDNDSSNRGGAIILHDKDNSHVTGFRAHDTTTHDGVYTLPATDGSANQVLETNGSGALSWTNVGGNLAEGSGITLTTSSGVTTITASGGGGGDEWGDPVDSHIVPDTDATYDLGTSIAEFRNGYFDGTVYADNLEVHGVSTFSDAIIPDSANSRSIGQGDSTRWAHAYVTGYTAYDGVGNPKAGFTNTTNTGTLAVLTLSSQNGILWQHAESMSDTSVKENQQDYTPQGLNLLTQLKPKSWNWVDDAFGDTSETQYGFIAQDVEAISSDYVKTNPDPRDDSKTLLNFSHKFLKEYDFSLLKAILELKDKNDALEARIAALEG